MNNQDSTSNEAADANRLATKPFSIRLTQTERDQLAAQAGGRPLSTFMRAKLLTGARATKPAARPFREVDRQLLASVLAGLGQSCLSQAINQLAKSANMGTLSVDAEVVSAFNDACGDIKAMRSALTSALLGSAQR